MDLYICKETEIKKDRETNDMSVKRAEKKPCKDDSIDIPSDDDWMIHIPVFESPAEPVIDGYQIPPAASCGSSVGQHVVREPGLKNEGFIHPSPQKRFDSGLLLFDNS